MKNLFLLSCLFAVTLTPLSSSKADEDHDPFAEVDRLTAEMKESYAETRRRNDEIMSDTKFEDRYNDPFASVQRNDRDDRVIERRTPKKSINQLDTWGRDGGQTMSSEEVLRRQMQPY